MYNVNSCFFFHFEPSLLRQIRLLVQTKLGIDLGLKFHESLCFGLYMQQKKPRIFLTFFLRIGNGITLICFALREWSLSCQVFCNFIFFAKILCKKNPVRPDSFLRILDLFQIKLLDLLCLKQTFNPPNMFLNCQIFFDLMLK